MGVRHAQASSAPPIAAPGWDAAHLDDSRPFAAPVTTATYTVSASITHDGSADASAALNSWISGTVPDGSIIDFAIPGAVYRMDDGILLAGKNNIVLEGHGTTTLRLASAGSDEAGTAFLLRGSSHVAIHGFNVLGPDTGWPTMNGENQHVLGLSGWYGGNGSTYVEMSDVVGAHVHGDAIYLEGKNSGGWEPSSYVWVHDCAFDYLGRNGVSFIDVTDVLIEHCSFNHVNYHVVDFEPNNAAQVVTRAVFQHNTCGSYAHWTTDFGFFVADVQVGDGIGAIISDVAIRHNTVAGIAACGKDGSPRGLDTKFVGVSAGHHANVTFIGNSTAQSRTASSVLWFAYVDGLTCVMNTQPISGTLVGTSNCTVTLTTPNP